MPNPFDQIFPKELFDKIIKDTLNNMDIVTQEDFVISQKVLQKTRAKVEALEKQVTALEKNLPC